MSENNLPHALEPEQALLGILLRKPSVLDDVSEYIPSAESFYFGKHRNIYQAILDLSTRNSGIDPITVSEELTKRDQLTDSGGRLYLIELVEGVATTSNATNHARLIQKYKTYRDIIEACSEIIRKCHKDKPETEEIQDFAESEITKITLKHRRVEEGHMADGLADLYERFNSKEFGGIPTGYEPVDKIIHCIKDGQMTVVAGRPSMGKTAFCLNVAQNAAVGRKVPVGIISLEMDKSSLQKRLLAGLSGVSVSSMEQCGLDRGNLWERVTKAGTILQEAPIYVAAPPTMSMFQLRSAARRLVLRSRVKLLIVDYLQLIAPVFYNRGIRENTTEISRLLKSLARELHVPLLVVSQLSREVEKRPDKRPQLSDLRESGAIEQDASDVLLMYRPSYYLKAELSDPNHKRHGYAKALDDRGDAKVIIAKQRQGPTGDADLFYHPEVCRFETFERKPSEESILWSEPVI